MNLSYIFNKIYTWFHNNKRILPWRQTKDPYKIWVSEIILQQTKVKQGIEYYFHFIKKFPTIKSLAKANEDEVLKSWQGLGYYSRARNLHHAAKEIESRYNGIFPDEYNKMLKLKGIGPYTAAAISSIAFNKPYPVLDGNVFRFLSRFYNIDEPINTTKGVKIFYHIADKILLKKDPGMHNQALMEFGSIQCIPSKPDCLNCPVIEWCIAFKKNKIHELPVKIKSNKKNNRYFYYFLIYNSDSVYLTKRTGNDIWKNLYDFPLIETKNELTVENILKSDHFKKITGNLKFSIDKISKTYIHILTHQKIQAKFIQIKLEKNHKFSNKYILINKKDIYNFAIPKLIESYLKDILWI